MNLLVTSEQKLFSANVLNFVLSSLPWIEKSVVRYVFQAVACITEIAFVNVYVCVCEWVHACVRACVRKGVSEWDVCPYASKWASGEGVALRVKNKANLNRPNKRIIFTFWFIGISSRSASLVMHSNVIKELQNKLWNVNMFLLYINCWGFFVAPWK